MTTIERIGRGLFFANLLTNAEKHGVRAPSFERMQRAWEQHPEKRDRWNKIAATILSEVPGLELGTMTGPREPFLMACGAKEDREGRAVQIVCAALIAATVGFLSGAMIAAGML